MSTLHEQWMQEAYVLAQKAAEVDEVPVGAVMVHNDRIIGSAYNQPITLNDPSAHAEILAMRKAGETLQNYRLLDTTLYVTLEPCAMCLGAMVHARIARVVFGAYDPKTGVVCSQDHGFEKAYFNHQPEVIGGVMAEPCGQLLQTFFRRRRG